MDKTLKILPLGGLGEVGMNCLILEWQDEIVLLDCGIQFPDASYTGVELLVPDFSYLKSKWNKIRGVVVTHGHDDHIGGVPFLAREAELNIFSTPFPQGLIQNKLEEYRDLKPIHFHEIRPDCPFQVGPFRFHPIRVQHSIIEALAFAIETPIGNLIHTGDFKHDLNEINGERITFEPFEAWGKKGVLLLLSDSTNAERAGHTLSEVDISKSFDGILSKQNGRLIVALFASNIRRIENLLRTAKRMHKKVAFVGRSMHGYTKLAHELDALEIPEDTLVLMEDLQKYRDDEVIVVATGSQAEPQSALVRVSQGIHKDLQIRSGDTVILSSRFIPGNERNITNMIDHLFRQGADVWYESIHQIHVSGHGFQEELMLMLKATRPKYFIPIHGEYRHLKKHAMLALQAGVRPENVCVIEDGQILEVGLEGARLSERLVLQKVAVMEGDLLQNNAELLLQRNALAKTGVVFAGYIRDSKSRKLLVAPQVAAHGLLFREGVVPTDTLREAIEHADQLYRAARDQPDLDERLRLEMRRFFKKRVSHKPLVIPWIVDL